MMRKKVLYAIALLLIIELLYVRIDGLSWKLSRWQAEADSYAVGFPFRSVSYTIFKMVGQMYPGEIYPEKDKWKPGLNVDILPLELDICIGVVLFYFFIRLLPFQVLKLILKACVIGIILVSAGHIFDEFFRLADREWWIFFPFVIFVSFVILPLSIYCFFHSSTKPKLSLVGAAFVATLSGLFAENRMNDILVSPGTTTHLSDLVYGLFFFIIISIECVLLDIIWRYLRKKHQCAEVQIATNLPQSKSSPPGA
jgi:hypothetical protein